MKRFLSLSLVFVLVLSMVGCSSAGGEITGDGERKQSAEASQGSDLMQGVEPGQISEEVVTVSGEKAVTLTDFAVRLFQESLDGEDNAMISPVSVLYALAMTANGAKGDTLTQMEEVLGMPVAELNACLKAYMDGLPEDEKYKLRIANSIWLTDDKRFTVAPDFLQSNADYYGADIYQRTFDAATCKDINTWVEDNTDGMIQNILNGIPVEAVMYLINAVAFDAEWEVPYKEHRIREGEFTGISGEKQRVDMMHSEEQWYLEDDKATGFIKHYADSEYAFVALLPKEDVSMQEYISALSGESLSSMLTNAQQTKVHTTMPKFESEYSAEMSEILSNMGMKNAFDEEKADFSGLGTAEEGNIFINRVIHKTFITVDENGTKAGAATMVEIVDGSAMLEEFKEVILNRPFVYMIMDCETNLPLFMGTLMEAE